MVVLVTGSGGQLGQSIQFIASQYPEMQFIFANSQDLDISNSEKVDAFFEENKIDFCINAAAYTAVDKAESDVERAELINVLGPKYLAIACQKHNATLLHVSTDFVFDGDYSKLSPRAESRGYSEEDRTNPIGVYGQTKLDGEIAVQANCKKHYIIRTSWVYSQFGNNFMKTMLRLAQDRDTLNVVADQIGTPTNAVDLAKTILVIIASNIQHPTFSNYGIYNFSNEGMCSWFEFAQEIFKQNKVTITVNPIPTEAYPTPAKRPKYSVMDKSKIKATFGISIKDWKEALAQTKL